MIALNHQITIDKPAKDILKALTTNNGISGWWTSDCEIKDEVGSRARFSYIMLTHFI